MKIQIDNVVRDATLAELAQREAEILRLENVEQARVAGEAAARSAAITHAKSLGFTDEMVSVMYPTLY